MEQILRERYGDPDYRLCQRFDLIAGTSGGAIVATLLSWGAAVADVILQYDKCSRAVFTRAPITQLLRHQYTDKLIGSELRRLFREKDGNDVLFGLIVLRRSC